MDRSLVTRIAPTPSGFLHRGNLLNFALITEWARHADAIVTLRIDDADSPRFRSEYLQDIFEALAFLGISVDQGPRALAEWEEWSQARRFSEYRRVVDALLENDAFICACSRTQISPMGRCVRGCSNQSLNYQAGVTSIRLPLTSGDIVIWRREDLPAYHLASVIDDSLFGVTHVIRGEDLIPSTVLQAELGSVLQEHGLVESSAFPDIEVAHHPLIRKDGQKLSKSTLRERTHEARTPDLRSWLRAEAERILPTVTFQSAALFR